MSLLIKRGGGKRPDEARQPRRAAVPSPAGVPWKMRGNNIRNSPSTSGGFFISIAF